MKDILRRLPHCAQEIKMATMTAVSGFKHTSEEKLDVALRARVPYNQHQRASIATILFLILVADTLAFQSSALTNPVVSLEFEGESEYHYTDKAGQLKFLDKNTFDLIISGCAWKLTLAPPEQRPPSPTQVADDGRNYYILSKGSGTLGKARRGKELIPYVDSATIFKSGGSSPRHHGMAVWLLFGRPCVAFASHGDIRDFLALTPGPNPPIFYYERIDDPNRNAFGPSLMQFFPGGDTNLNHATPIAELEVLEARVDNGNALPKTVELRLFDFGVRGDPKEQRLTSIYKLSIRSVKSLTPAVEIRPEIERPTLIVDYRGDFGFQYVAETWKTPREAKKILESGNGNALVPQPAKPRIAVWLWMAALLFLAAVVLRKLVLRAGDSKQNNNKITNI